MALRARLRALGQILEPPPDAGTWLGDGDAPIEAENARAETTEGDEGIRGTVLKSDDGAGVGLPAPGDPDGSRASALQRAVSIAAPNAELHLSGTYNFSTSSFLVAGKVGLTLSASKSGPPAMFVFQYRSDVLPHDMQTSGALHPGVNISHSRSVTLRFAAIDYLPKARVLFCKNPRAGCGEGVGPSGPGITIHMFNSSSCVIEDVAVHAAP